MFEHTLPTFVAFDLETTGLFPEIDRIIEIGAVRFEADGTERGRYERLVRPDRPISAGAKKVHGIHHDDLAQAPSIETVLPDFLGWLGDANTTLLLAHNARFDAAFLGRAIARLGRPLPDYRIADTLSLARRRLPESVDHKLATLSRSLRFPDEGPEHRALADGLRVMRLWLALDGPLGHYQTYRFFDPSSVEPPPAGWETLAWAISRGRPVRLRYAGGSRGDHPRDVTPSRMHHQGGAAYMDALCHLDGKRKRFRLDLILTYEVLESAGAAPTGQVPRTSDGSRPGQRA